MSTPPVHTVRNTLALLVPITAILAGCSDEKAPQALKIETSSEPAVTEPKHDWFTDAASESGLDFIHLAGLTGEHYYVEIVPPGCALFDYDNDGDLDVYIVQGTPLEPDASISDAWTDTDLPADFTPTNRLYRNDLIPGGELRFADVTEGSGLGAEGYGMGVAVGDYDNDGDPDVFLTRFGPNTLYRNNGDGTFAAVTLPGGLDEERWSASASFFDYDRDGDQHYDHASALIKSIRGCDPDAAIYWLALMLEAGEDARFIARRLAILASEDIGNADPRGIMVAEAAWSLVERIGPPEERIILAQCATYLALAPKSNASYTAINEAMADVREGRTADVPSFLRDKNKTESVGSVQDGKGYQYSHNAEIRTSIGGVTPQDYLGNGRTYYQPTETGFDKVLKDRLDEVKRARDRSK